MNFFLDTSALAKLFLIRELCSEKIINLVCDSVNDIWVLELAQVEFHSAIYRRFRSGEINNSELVVILNEFDHQFTQFHIEPMTSLVLDEARNLLKRFGKKDGLRTLDALQLAGFTLIAEKTEWFFVCADRLLCAIAEKAGFQTIHAFS